jgi:hypothetical protein
VINVHQKLARLGGGDEATLDLVPSARSAFVQIAVALLVTASVAATSMWFAIHDALHVHWLGAGVMALFWFIVILGIDRTLMLLGMGGGRGATIVSVTGRLMAAVLIGVVVSTPLTLRMFASDIDAQIAEIQASQSATNKTWIADSQQQERVDDLAQQVDDWENIAAGVLPASFADEDSSAMASRIATLQKRLPRLRHAADQAAILYNCDTYGGGRDQLDDPEKCAPVPGENGNSTLYRAGRMPLRRPSSTRRPRSPPSSSRSTTPTPTSSRRSSPRLPVSSPPCARSSPRPARRSPTSATGSRTPTPATPVCWPRSARSGRPARRARSSWRPTS